MEPLSLESITRLQDTLLIDMQAFLPELILCGGIILLLLIRLFNGSEKLQLGYVAIAVCALALGAAWTQWMGDLKPTSDRPRELFSGLLVYDLFTIYLRLFLIGAAALTIWLSLLTGIPDREDSADFFSLLLGATVGMMMMASANHLLMVYIAVEMASLPSYALAGFLKGRRQSSEAALKYVVYGGAASGVMLYGISLVAGRFGTAYLPEVTSGFIAVVGQGSFDPVLLAGSLLILIGIAFKIAAVPFHFWCPDVFEGAAAEVAGFLSVASKGAALALLGRFSLAMVGSLTTGDSPVISGETWKTMATYLGPAIAFFAAVTATFGNLAAYAQTNLKRLLAYSTIAHAGYMMMAVAALKREGLDGVLVYLAAYLFMNLGAFAVVAFIRNRTGSEDLSTYGGMIWRAPVLTVAMALFLLSLLGIPPLMGFVAKWQVFAALYEASIENPALLGLVVIGLLNTALSAFYYLKVLKVMIIDPVPAGQEAPLPLSTGQGLYASLLAAFVTAGILSWDFLAVLSRTSVGQFPEARGRLSAIGDRPSQGPSSGQPASEGGQPTADSR